MVLVDVLVEQIKRKITDQFGGTREVPTRNEILIHIRQGLAYLIKGSFFENSKVDDLLYADDAFIIPVKSAVVNAEQDYKFISLPNLPVSLPRGRGIISVRPSGSIANSYLQIQRKDLDIMLSHERNKNIKRVVFFQEGTRIVFKAFGGATIANNVDYDLVAPCPVVMGQTLNVPDDVEAKLIEYVVNVLGEVRVKPEDQNTDGINAI